MPTGCAAVRCSLRHLLAPPQRFQLLGAVFVTAAVHNMNQWVRLGVGVYPNISFPKPVWTMPDKIFLFFRLSRVHFLLWHTNHALRHTLALSATAWEVAEKQFYFAEMFRMENLLCWGFLSFFLSFFCFQQFMYWALDRNLTAWFRWNFCLADTNIIFQISWWLDKDQAHMHEKKVFFLRMVKWTSPLAALTLTSKVCFLEPTKSLST